MALYAMRFHAIAVVFPMVSTFAILLMGDHL
jgi:hypothetical protein